MKKEKTAGWEYLEERRAPVAIKFDKKDEAKGLDLLIKNLQAPIVGLADGVFVIESNLLKIFDDAHISYKTVKLEGQDVSDIYNKFKD